MEKGTTTVKNTMAVSQKVKHEITMLLYHPVFPSAYTPKELEAVTQTEIYTPMFTAASFTIAQRKQLKCPLVNEWINKTWYIQGLSGKSPATVNTKRMVSATSG